MSYTVVPPAPRPRPATVTAARSLLSFWAGVQVLSLGLSLSTIGPIGSALDESVAGKPEADAVRTAAIVAVIFASVISVCFAVATAVVGVQVGRGRNAARIVAWVIGGIAVLCYG